jgi:hypothetical protein
MFFVYMCVCVHISYLCGLSGLGSVGVRVGGCVCVCVCLFASVYVCVGWVIWVGVGVFCACGWVGH